MTTPDPICTNPASSHGTHGGDGGPCLGCGWTDPAYALTPDQIEAAIAAAIDAGLWAAAHAPCPKCARVESCRCRTSGRKPTEAAVRAAAPILIAAGVTAGREEAQAALYRHAPWDELISIDDAARIARGSDA